MLYYLFNYLEKFNFPGARLFHYLSFRSALAIILSLLFTLFFGKKMIRYLQRLQIGEEIRNLGLEGQMQKRGTPTMGGSSLIFTSLALGIILSVSRSLDENVNDINTEDDGITANS